MVGPTATGKSALGLALAERFQGEIVACDSTAVYRGIDIGTDKVPLSEQRGVPHHLVNVAEPTDTYSAARYARDASTAIRAIAAGGRLPILVGGTGFYYRALVRGLFPGPERDEALRARLERVADRRGVEALHRWLVSVDAPVGGAHPAARPKTARARARGLPADGAVADLAFRGRRSSPIAGTDVLTIGVDMPRPDLRARVARARGPAVRHGVVAEVQRLLAAGVPEHAHAFSGLVYRQVMEMLAGVRDERATRELIVQENMRYARRQLIWFRKESGVHWLAGPGESEATLAAASTLVSNVPAPHVNLQTFTPFKICQYSIRQFVNAPVSCLSSSSWTPSAPASCRTPPVRRRGQRHAWQHREGGRAQGAGIAVAGTGGGRGDWRARPAPRGAFGRMAEASAGKDSVTGHWEMMGVVLDKPFPTFPQGFPPA